MNKIRGLRIQKVELENINNGKSNSFVAKLEGIIFPGDPIYIHHHELRYKSIKLITAINTNHQKMGYAVISVQDVPATFEAYIGLTELDQSIFREIIVHFHTKGKGVASDTLVEIAKKLVSTANISASDQQWYMEYWGIWLDELDEDDLI